MKQKFYVNSDERICKVTLECDEGTFNGIATCSDEDTFDILKGLSLANKRALLQVKQADVKQFVNEVKSYDKQIRAFLNVVTGYAKAKRKLNKAKRCLSDLYKEIAVLSGEVEQDKTHTQNKI